jgi:hypothetical protein
VHGKSLLLAACISALAILPAPLCAQGGDGTHPRVVVTLHDGSIVVGEMTAQDSITVTIHTELFGQLLIPRSKISGIAGEVTHAPVAAPAESAAHPEQQSAAPPAPNPVQWTTSINLSVNYASGTVSGYQGETRGAELGVTIERITELLQFKLEIAGAYQVTDPNPESRNEANLKFVASRKLGGPFSLRSETLVEHNAVEELDYRIFEQFGLGWTAVQSEKFSLLLTPGMGYTEEHGAGPDRLGDSPRQKFKDDHGIAAGIFEQIIVRPAPAFTITQDYISFHALDDNPRLQYTATVKLLGMMSRHVGMTIEYKREFDSQIPDPINKTLERLSAGIQLSF